MSKFTIKNNREKRGEQSKWNVLKNISVGFISVLFLAGIFFLYLRQVNSSTSRVFEMQELESEVGRLEVKNDSLKLEIAEIKSMDKLEDRIASLNLVKEKEVAYLEEKDVLVAKNSN